MKIDYDIIVVGAGPTGATCAKILAGKGLSVLVVDKSKLPRYKSCSGMIIAKTARLVKEYFQAELPDSVKCTPYDNYGMVFVNDDGKEYKFEQRGFNVWRSSFDNFLLSKAVESGATVIDGVSVINCKNFDDCVEVTLSDKSIGKKTAKYLVDCEGAMGVIKRKLLNCTKDFIVTYQAFYDGKINLDPHYFYAYLQSQFSEYDAWFNVKDDILVLGVAVEQNNINDIKEYNDNFIKYMQSNHGLKIDKKVKEEKWIMPHIRPDFHIDYGIGRTLFAGEVAGFLNPMGEGISCGMESGYYAAKSILDNFQDPQKVLTAYRQNTTDLKAYMKRQWNLVSIISSKFKNM
ncbi:MAG: NAD(P)/FAD-dependent oxidoreductase, partial [Clostridia bacterium]|nr:NAD(P)/FAD-dependent oxidoreductase [Clostridia bacterium]